MNKFRLLRADEIDCRIAQIRENGLSLLLYKDARVDQNILDETVGEMNWQKSYSRENANCTVSIWDDAKKMWISKEDTGTESNTEKEKGLASDSFKRACFCWGIGRELYSAPLIWIKPEDCRTFGKNQSGKLVCNDRFYVSRIEYSDARNITALEITNRSTGKVVYRVGGQRPAVAHSAAPTAQAMNRAYNSGCSFSGSGRSSCESGRRSGKSADDPDDPEHCGRVEHQGTESHDGCERKPQEAERADHFAAGRFDSR